MKLVTRPKETTYVLELKQHIHMDIEIDQKYHIMVMTPKLETAERWRTFGKKLIFH